MKITQNMKIGLLTVIWPAEPLLRPRGDYLARWLCKCDCGNIKIVLSQSLQTAIRKGNTGTRSCGCLRETTVVKHGHTRSGKHSPEYAAWMGAKKRCENEFDPNYGGRGIRVSPLWVNDFIRFLADMGPRPGSGWSLDRIDVNGGYEPGNCQWVRIEQQSANRRTSVIYDFHGERLTIGQIALRLGVNRDRAGYLAKRGKLDARRLGNGYELAAATCSI